MYRLHGFFTQNSMKPLYVLEELGVDYKFHFIDLAKGENRSEEFLAMNPVGKVPVLEHDGNFLFESGAICRYLPNVEQSALYPADPLKRARVDQWMDFFSCHLGRNLSTIFFEEIIKPGVGLGTPDEDAVEEAHKFSRQQLRMLEGWLGHEAWLANDTLSVADLFALAYIEQVRIIKFPLDDFPRVQEWFSRLEALDSVARARARVAPYMAAHDAA